MSSASFRQRASKPRQLVSVRFWTLPVVVAIGFKASVGSQEGRIRRSRSLDIIRPSVLRRCVLILTRFCTLCDCCGASNMACRARQSAWEASLGITGPQRLVLRIVSQRPGLSPGEVARIVHLHPSTITGILQRLVKKRLLRIDRDGNDHRRIRLRAQAAAREFIAASTGTVESAVTRALTRIPTTRCARAMPWEVLSAIASALADDGARPRGSTNGRKSGRR